MATPEQIPTDLTLDIGDDLASEDFAAAVRNFVDYIAEITAAQRADGAAVAWTVKVKGGSALIGLEPNADAPAPCLEMIYEKAKCGLETLEAGGIKDAGLSDKAIGSLKSLSEIDGRYADGRGIRFWVRREPVEIGSGIARRVREDLKSGGYCDHGTLEGRLEAIRDAKGALEIRIKDDLFSKAIRCMVPENMIDRVFAGFRRRVEIEGRIHYRRDGAPVRIEAQAVDILPEDSDLPTAADVRGIMASA